MAPSLYVAIESFLYEQYEAGDIHVNDGDCDLVAFDFCDAVEGLRDPDVIREAVKVRAFWLADAGMLGEPETHHAVAELVLKHYWSGQRSRRDHTLSGGGER